MLVAQSGTTVQAVLTGAAVGLLATLRASLVEAPATEHIAPTGAGIVASNTGGYVWSFTVPTVTQPTAMEVVWTDPSFGSVSEELVVLVEPVEVTPIVPTLEQLGALLRARTRDLNNVEQGTFTADTRPTGFEASEVIASAEREVRATFGWSIPALAVGAVRQLVLYRAAQLVEASYFPEQIGTDASVHDTYRDLYAALLPATTSQVAELVAGGAGGAEGESGASAAARASFPDPVNEMHPVGWRTRW